MRKHRVQCTVRGCRKHYVAAVLAPRPFSDRPIFPTFPSACLCPYHFEENYVRNYLAPRLPLSAIHLAQATRYLKKEV